MNATAKTIEHETGKSIAQVPDNTESAAMMSLIERVASDKDMDVEKLERMLAMKRQYDADLAARAFGEAMARVQARIEPIIADADNKQTGSRYSKLTTIVQALAPIYTAEGFSVSFGTADCTSKKLEEAGWFRTTAELSHSGGHSKTYHVDLPADTTGPQGKVNKTMIHGTKSAITYARVILMGLMFNFTTTLDVDDDGNGAGKKPDPNDEPATEEQLAKIAEWRDAGKISDKTEAWIKKASPLTVGQATHLLNELKVRNPS